MKVKVLYDEERPKVDPVELKRVIRAAGLEVTTRKPEIGIVVGGDGIFSEYGKTETEPLLFVGVKSNKATGSKAYMAETYFDELPNALVRLKEGRDSVKDCSRLEVFKNGRSLGEIFTDVYLQRGDESNSLRYRVKVAGPGGDIEESVIGDGVVVTTSAGSKGYYSYPDRMKGDVLDPDAFSNIGEGQVGICHIAPTYAERSGSREHLLRYAVPWGSRIEMWITRPANAKLYGIESGRGGIKVTTKDRITVAAGMKATKVIVLNSSQVNSG